MIGTIPVQLTNPLSAFLFTRDQGAIDYFLGSLSFGGAINQVNIHLFVETMPFGGVGNSGIGNYYGKNGFDFQAVPPTFASNKSGLGTP